MSPLEALELVKMALIVSGLNEQKRVVQAIEELAKALATEKQDEKA